MMQRRFPRLSPVRAKILLEEMKGLTPAQLEERASVVPDLLTEHFAATGSPKIAAVELIETRDLLRAAMESAGYPGTTLGARQSVDRALSIALATAGLPIGEMLRPDTWAWLATHLLPGYVQWRWGKKDGSVTEERFSGPVVRNALGRLWLRGWVFDRGPQAEDRWGLVNTIPEDATVAVLERTSVSSDHRLARAIVEAWRNAAGEGTGAEAVLRSTMIRARILSAVVETQSLSEPEIQRFVSEIITSSCGQLRPETA